MAAPGFGQAFSPAEISAGLEGVKSAKFVTIAFFSLTIYEYLITLDQEIEYFWAGAWTSSRVLFFLNRYLSPVTNIVIIMCFFPPHSSMQLCGDTLQGAFLLDIVGVTIIQGIHVIRVWYIFCDSKRVRVLILGSFMASFITSLYFILASASDARIVPFFQMGCFTQGIKQFWRIFLPSLVLHTFLYILTVYRALRNRRAFKRAPIMKRLVRDGGLFYFVIFISVSVVSIGSFLRDPRINTPAVFSSFHLASTSIATSRLLFSIHSLAAHIGSDSAWLLNNAELSRVGWKQGAHEGEIIVERCSAYDDDDEESAKSVHPVKISRVGVFE